MSPIFILGSFLVFLFALILIKKRQNAISSPEKVWLFPPNMPLEKFSPKINQELLDKLEKRLKKHRYILGAGLEIDKDGFLNVRLLPNHDALQAEAKASVIGNLRETYRRVLLEINNSAQERYPKIHAFWVLTYDQWREEKRKLRIPRYKSPSQE